MKMIVTAMLMAWLSFVSLAHAQEYSFEGSEEISDEEVAVILDEDFYRNILPPSQQFNFSAEELKDLERLARAAHANLSAEHGDHSTIYDVVVQSGHFFRIKGDTGSEYRDDGVHIWEQHAVAIVAEKLKRELSARGLKVLLIGGRAKEGDVLAVVDGHTIGDYLLDDPDTEEYDGLSTKVFLSLHMDGEINPDVPPCERGPGLGYPNKAYRNQMRALGGALAMSLDYDPAKFLMDNRVRNLSRYYGYRDVKASEWSGLVELGFAKCASDVASVISRSDLLARNLAIQIQMLLQQ